MLNLDLSVIAEWTRGRLRGDNRTITSVSTDSRKLAEGALFVALRGERHDAHEFLDAAASAGAAAALVERALDTTLPQVVVADSQLAWVALREVRAQRRLRSALPARTASHGQEPARRNPSRMRRRIQQRQLQHE